MIFSSRPVEPHIFKRHCLNHTWQIASDIQYGPVSTAIGGEGDEWHPAQPRQTLRLCVLLEECIAVNKHPKDTARFNEPDDLNQILAIENPHAIHRPPSLQCRIGHSRKDRSFILLVFVDDHADLETAIPQRIRHQFPDSEVERIQNATLPESTSITGQLKIVPLKHIAYVPGNTVDIPERGLTNTVL